MGFPFVVNIHGLNADNFAAHASDAAFDSQGTLINTATLTNGIVHLVSFFALTQTYHFVKKNAATR